MREGIYRKVEVAGFGEFELELVGAIYGWKECGLKKTRGFALPICMLPATYRERDSSGKRLNSLNLLSMMVRGALLVTLIL